MPENMASRLHCTGIMTIVNVREGAEVSYDDKGRFMTIPKWMADSFVKRNKTVPIYLEHDKRCRIGALKRMYTTKLNKFSKKYDRKKALTSDDNDIGKLTVLVADFVIDDPVFIDVVRTVTLERFTHTTPVSFQSSDNFLHVTDCTGADPELDITAEFALKHKLPELSIGHNVDTLDIDELSVCVAGARDLTLITSVKYEEDGVNMRSTVILPDDPDTATVEATTHGETADECRLKYTNKIASFHSIGNAARVEKVRSDMEAIGVNGNGDACLVYNKINTSYNEMENKKDCITAIEDGVGDAISPISRILNNHLAVNDRTSYINREHKISSTAIDNELHPFAISCLTTDNSDNMTQPTSVLRPSVDPQINGGSGGNGNVMQQSELVTALSQAMHQVTETQKLQQQQLQQHQHQQTQQQYMSVCPPQSVVSPVQQQHGSFPSLNTCTTSQCMPQPLTSNSCLGSDHHLPHSVNSCSYHVGQVQPAAMVSDSQNIFGGRRRTPIMRRRDAYVYDGPKGTAQEDVDQSDDQQYMDTDINQYEHNESSPFDRVPRSFLSSRRTNRKRLYPCGNEHHGGNTMTARNEHSGLTPNMKRTFNKALRMAHSAGFDTVVDPSTSVKMTRDEWEQRMEDESNSERDSNEESRSSAEVVNKMCTLLDTLKEQVMYNNDIIKEKSMSGASKCTGAKQAINDPLTSETNDNTKMWETLRDHGNMLENLVETIKNHHTDRERVTSNEQPGGSNSFPEKHIALTTETAKAGVAHATIHQPQTVEDSLQTSAGTTDHSGETPITKYSMKYKRNKDVTEEDMSPEEYKKGVLTAMRQLF